MWLELPTTSSSLAAVTESDAFKDRSSALSLRCLNPTGQSDTSGTSAMNLLLDSGGLLGK